MTSTRRITSLKKKNQNYFIFFIQLHLTIKILNLVVPILINSSNFTNFQTARNRIHSQRRDDEITSCEREDREKNLFGSETLVQTVQISMDQSRSYKSWPVQCYLALPVRRTDISRTPPRNIPTCRVVFCAVRRRTGHKAYAARCPLHLLRYVISLSDGEDNRGQGKGIEGDRDGGEGWNFEKWNESPRWSTSSCRGRNRFWYVGRSQREFQLNPSFFLLEYYSIFVCRFYVGNWFSSFERDALLKKGWLIKFSSSFFLPLRSLIKLSYI